MPSLLVSARHRFRRSLVAKIFATCFVATHLPLLAVIAYLVLTRPADAMPVLAVVLCATLVATGAALAAMHGLVRPLGQVAEAMRLYGERGEVRAVATARADEVGILARGLEELVVRLETTLSGLRSQAYKDPLTQAGNRRWLAQTAESLLVQARRENEAPGVIAFDIDHFKMINDRHGHRVGDAVLIAVAREVQRLLRAFDLFARQGGEEFCVFLQGASAEGALETAELLRQAIARIEVSPLRAGEITASFGLHVADVRVESLEDMLDAADRQMYEAKRLGRNRVCVSMADPGSRAARDDPAGRRRRSGTG